MYGWYLEGITDDDLCIYPSFSTIFPYFNKTKNPVLFFPVGEKGDVPQSFQVITSCLF